MQRVVVCKSTPLDEFKRAQMRALFDQIVEKELNGEELPILFPSDSYSICFERRADPVLDKSVRSMLDNVRRRVAKRQYEDAPGVIYTFWISGQPTDQIKIGRSTQTPTQRIMEWNRVIATADDNTPVVNQMHACETKYNVLAESIIHTMLTCEQISHLRHPKTGNALTEFFRIDNLARLRIFIALVIRYTDAKGNEIIGQSRV
mgnify:CR=1 FL=1